MPLPDPETLHQIGAGATGSAIAAWLARALGGWALVATLRPYVGPWWALLACAVVGYAKERWDRRGHGTYDPRDFWAGNAGGVLALLADAALVFTFQAITTPT